MTLTAGSYGLRFKAAQRANGNGGGQRVRVSFRSSAAAEVVKTFVWCGTQICEERNKTGEEVTKRFYAEGEQWVNGSETTNYFYTRDHLGSIREVIDSEGGLLAQYDYDPYGNRIVLKGKIDIEFGYAGYYYHAPSGLNLTMYRAYDPKLGRWLSRDPIEEAGGLNLYGYVGNDPAGVVDPKGLAGIAIGNNSRTRFTFIGIGEPTYYISPQTFAPSRINNAFDALQAFLLGDGRAVPLGPDLTSELQLLQETQQWKCGANDLRYADYVTLRHPVAATEVYLALGSLHYIDNGVITTYVDKYEFPLENSDFHGGTSHRNWALHYLLGWAGTPYEIYGSWPTRH